MLGRTRRASGLYGHARSLAKAGKAQEAFDVTKQALDSLPDPEPDSADPSAALIIVWTVFYVELAATLGRSADTNDAIKRALRLSSQVDNHKTDPYVLWLQQQLKE
jgi:hypothetical protein